MLGGKCWGVGWGHMEWGRGICVSGEGQQNRVVGYVWVVVGYRGGGYEGWGSGYRGGG